MIEIGQTLKTYLGIHRPTMIQCFEVILAQFVFESGWGKSDLAIKAHNYGGLKYRKELDHICSDTILYEDWEGKADKYFKCNSNQQYCALYFGFIGRKRYQGFDGLMPSAFLYHLAINGYVGSIDGVQKKNFKLVKDYQKAIADAYVKKISSIMRGISFSVLLGDIEYYHCPNWLEI